MDILYKQIVTLVPIEHHGEHDAKVLLEDSFKVFQGIIKGAANLLDEDTESEVVSLCDAILTLLTYHVNRYLTFFLVKAFYLVVE